MSPFGFSSIGDWSLGGCTNASPAGKRRIATGSEPQVSSLNEIKEDGELEAAASSSHLSHSVRGVGVGLHGDRGGGSEGGGGIGSGAFLMQFSSPFAAITALAVAACLLIMLVFVTIFAVLQVIQ